MKRKLLTGLILGGVAALLFLFAAPSYRQGEPSVAGRTAPQFSFTLDGRSAKLADLRGKVVVLNFWASWCPPCVDEMPSLSRLQEKLAPLGGTVLGVSVDEDAAAYEKFLVDNRVSFPTYRDPSKRIAASYGTYMYPETYIINRHGHIARKIIGAQDWNSPEMATYLRDLLSNR